MSNPKRVPVLAILLLLLVGCAAKRPTMKVSDTCHVGEIFQSTNGETYLCAEPMPPYVTHSEWGYVAHCPNGEAGWWATKPSDEDVTEFCGGR
jgi:hypothetical protein